MATAIIQATRKIRTVTFAEVNDETGLAAPKEDYAEVLGYRSMRLTLRVLSLTGDTPQAGIQMETGMDIDDDAGFVSLGLFDLVGTSTDTQQRVFTDLMRYVRWRVMALEGSDATIVFSIDGIAYE